MAIPKIRRFDDRLGRDIGALSMYRRSRMPMKAKRMGTVIEIGRARFCVHVCVRVCEISESANQERYTRHWPSVKRGL